MRPGGPSSPDPNSLHAERARRLSAGRMSADDKRGNASAPGGDISAGETIGYQEEYSTVMEWRRKMVRIMDTILFEVVVILLVMLYAVVVFVQLTVAGQVGVDPVHCYTGNTTHPDYVKDCEPSVSSTQDFLNTLDLAFLSVFVFEICFRLLGYGIAFLRDGVQLLDTVVVVLAFITALVPSSAIASGGNFLNLLRIIRLLRLALIFSRLQRSRDAAAMRSKRAMYRRLGAPVEKVLAFLTEFKGRQRAKRDQDNIDWMMEVIASDELYSVAEFDEDTLLGMQGAAGGATDMSRYLTETTGLARRKPHFDSEEEDAEDEAAGVKSSSASMTVKQRKMSASEDSNWATAAMTSPTLASKLARMVSAEGWSFDLFELDVRATLSAAPPACWPPLRRSSRVLATTPPLVARACHPPIAGVARSSPHRPTLHPSSHALHPSVR